MTEWGCLPILGLALAAWGVVWLIALTAMMK